MTRKIQTLFMVLLLVGLSTVSYGQVTHRKWAQSNIISKTEFNTSLEKKVKLVEALNRLEQKFNVSFIYESGLLKGKYVPETPKLSDHFGKELIKLLEPVNLTYSRVNERTFVIRKDMVVPYDPKSLQVIRHQVSGTVTDGSSGDPLPGVNVIVRGTTIGTSTNKDGKYSLNVPSAQDTLVFSFIGFKNQQIPIRGRDVVNITMQPTTLSGQQITVVGYGEQSTETLTGSISSVSSSEVSKVPVGNLGNTLLGKTPGLQAVQTTSLPGESGPSIFIRGVSSLSADASHPIFVIDGDIVQNGRAFGQLDPDNIQSISVLKDASATAVYGVEGANGVIVVKTKRGRNGAPKISVNTSVGLQAPTVTQQFVDSYTYARAYNEAQETDGIDPSHYRFDTEALNAFKYHTHPIVYADMNWEDYLTKPVAPQTRTNINISGGTQDVQYYIAAGFLRQDGFLKDFPSSPSVHDFNPSYNRYNLRSNLDIDVTKTTQLSITASGRVGTAIRARSGNWLGIYSSTPFSGAGIVDGKIVTSNRLNIAGRRANVTPRLFGSGYNKNIENTLNLHLSGDQKLNFITKGLEFQLKGAYKSYYTEYKHRYSDYAYYQPFFRTDLDPTAPGDSSVVYQKIGSDGILNYSESYSRDRDWYIEGRLHYERQIGPHDFEGLLLYSQRQNYYPSSYTSIPRRLVTTVSRINYNYKRRYLLELSMGYNGSQNFAEGHRFGFFPAVSAGWILTNEPFMKDVGVLDFLKLRASYGVVGNDQEIGRFLYLPDQYNSSAGGYNFGNDVPQNKPGVSEGRIGNHAITWEKSKKQNYGIDVRILNDRLKMSFDYFRERRSNILTTRNTIPNYVAADLPAANIGKVENHGYEAQIKWQQQVGDFFYSIGGNVSFARNKILYMDEIPKPFPYLEQTGRPVGQKFGYVFDGYYTQDEIDHLGNGVAKPTWEVKPGFLKFKDLNGDGILDSNDQMPVGYPQSSPEYTFGSDVNLGYKGISLSMTWAAATHVSEQIQYSPYQTPFGGGNNYSVMKWQWEGRWTPEKGQNATYPRFSLDALQQRNNKNADYWMADASYIRLKSIEISYSFNRELLQRLGLGLRDARVYLSGYNLLTFSGMMDKYSIDPEQNGTNYQAQYPVMKTYNFGIKLDF